jgi:predicted HTH domain antitoxin
MFRQSSFINTEVVQTLAQSNERPGATEIETSKVIALELFREGRVSLGLAAKLCRTPIEMFMDYAGERGRASGRLADDRTYPQGGLSELNH